MSNKMKFYPKFVCFSAYSYGMAYLKQLYQKNWAIWMKFRPPTEQIKIWTIFSIFPILLYFGINNNSLDTSSWVLISFVHVF